MVDNRLDRELQTREKISRKRSWQRPDVLPSPKDDPNWDFHWVRVSTRGEADPTNVSLKMREGWEPVKAEEQPKFSLLVDPNSRFKDNIEISGLLLCKTPEELVQQRNDYYADVTKKQMESVDNSFMKQNDPRMPLFNEKRSTASFGKGR